MLLTKQPALTCLGYIGVALLACEALAAENAPLTVCELLANAARFNGKVVTVRGVLQATSEGAWLTGLDCSPLITKCYSWPTEIWLETSRRRVSEHNYEFEALRRRTEAIEEEMRRAGADAKRDRIWLTYIGHFQTHEHLEDYVECHGAKQRGIGFGHLNVSPGEIIVMTLKDLVVEKVKQEDAKRAPN